MLKIIGFFLVVYLTSTTQSSLSLGKTVKEGENVDIGCSLSANEGVNWFFQPKNSKLKFLLYLTVSDKIMYRKDSRLDCRRFHGKVSLTVKGFRKEHSGKYYCVLVRNMNMEFGDVVAWYLEEIKTTPKTTTAVTSAKVKPTTASEKTSCTTAESGLAKKVGKISCHFFIWGPLTCAASMLLLALIVISVFYCKRPRRRRCQHQFRKRPIPEGIRRPSNNYH
ncbi:T-cell surface glycoprotein CD8 alpha chain isoform X2 [Mobula birostris]|uniref:T-cell surface glycoprotein CD8 alpha chain isoform X2 n=1 Tax=Mobula birostris TaxID=1983395 RepID=UPI003B284D65